MKGLEAITYLKECLDDKYYGNELTIIEEELDTLETLKKHIKVVNGQLIFKGISQKKNKKDYQKILEVLGL